MGYDYQSIQAKTDDAKDVVRRCKEAFEKAGFKVSDETEIRGTLHMDVKDPTSGREVKLDVSTSLALADGYLTTGSVVIVQSNIELGLQSGVVKNIPALRGMNADMQGRASDETGKVIKAVTRYLKLRQA